MKKAQLFNIALLTGKSEATTTTNPENLFEHYKALDSIVAVKDRFDQTIFKLFTQAEQLFLNALGIQDVTDELKVLETHFKDDYDFDSLTSEPQLLPTTFECKPINLEDVLKVLKSLSREKHMLVRNCVTAKRTILTAYATSASKSFLMLKRIKTWLQSRMAQKRLSSVSIWYDIKSFFDDISQPHAANGFADHLPDRKNVPVDPCI